MKIVMTGGHHSSALPVISEFKKRNPKVCIYWLGHKHSLQGDKNTTLEYRDITSLGIPFFNLNAGKFYRTYNLLKLLKIPFGFFQSLYLLSKLHPDIIVSFGGYLAVPVVIAGWILGIPSISHEQTVVAGYANKLISHFVKKIFISWETSKQYYPEKKTVFTGLPLRKEIYTSTSNHFPINPQLPTIYITAGKSGSVKINEVIKSLLPQLLINWNVIHQCGDHSQYPYVHTLRTTYETIKDKVPGVYHPVKFVHQDEIGEVYEKADLVISRAGAHTTFELLTLQKPSILIPIPWVSHNEQQLNAEVLVKEGLGTILQESSLTPDNLFCVVEEKIIDIHKEKKKRTVSIPGYTCPEEVIVAEIEKLVQKDN